MNKTFSINLFYGLTRLFIVCLLSLAGLASADESSTNTAESLRAKYAELGPQLSNNPFKRPLYLVSTELPGQLKGDIYARIDYPFSSVKNELIDPNHWCDVLILHLNTKYCRASINSSRSILTVSIGKKTFQSLDSASPVEFVFSVTTTAPDYFDVWLKAKKGPLGTSDYRIQLEAVSLPENKTFLHLTYAYAYNFAGRLAMQAYLATIGSGKVGFTSTGKLSNGQPDYIGGIRGVVERNTMRYYLAIDAYLAELPTPPADQFEKRLQHWFSSTELYPLQLHEIDRADYLDMKRREYLRQQTPQ
ncbi:MAG: hypothetical protein P4L87_12055 [Formivibrio sp.]|nr:hypothetical protein [Formivibrio sp.]